MTRTIIFGRRAAAEAYAREHDLAPWEWFHVSSVEGIKGIEASPRDPVVVLPPLDDDAQRALDLWPTRVRLP
jgi:hypothetical protein